MRARDSDADAVFRDIVATYTEVPDMTSKRMFGSTALLVDGHIAAFVEAGGRLVVKLPIERVAELDAFGEPMVMGGRAMKAWFALRRDPDLDWFALTAEAVAHVRAFPPSEQRRR